MSDARRFIVIGATGAVGGELLELLASRGCAEESVTAMASANSAGVAAGPFRYPVVELDPDRIEKGDIVFLCAGSELSTSLAPVAVKRGARVIDSSSAFRGDPGVPLVVPEINGDTLAGSLLVASPNCSATILCLALAPLLRTFGLGRVVVSTYQAVSGAGADGLRELSEQTRSVLDGGTAEPVVFPEPIAFNVFCHETAVDWTTGQNGEEEKIIRESRRILDVPELPITATCVRVPVHRAHAESVNVTLERPATEEEMFRIFADAAGLRIVDDRHRNRFPTPLRANGEDVVLVGRIRPDRSQPSSQVPVRHRGFDFFLCGDQLRKGAALNALQIADLMHRA